MKTSEQINEISKALSQLQGGVESVKKDKKNPYFKSFYADLGSIWGVIREKLKENGLSVIQDATNGPDGVSILTRILHQSGQWIEFGPLTIPVNKKDAQGVGSAITYGRRYAMGGALGISDEDDDGEFATACAPKEKPKECSWDDYKKFVDAWSLSYEQDLVNKYIEYVLEYLSKKEGRKVSKREVVFRSIENPDDFEKAFKSWMEKNQPKGVV